MSRDDSEERDDVTSVDRQDLDPALSAMAWEDTGEREYVILNNKTPHSRFRAVMRKLRKRLLGFTPVLHPVTYLLEPTRRVAVEQAAVLGCAALIAGGATASGPDDLHRTYQTPIPLLATLPQATAYVERVPAPLSTPSRERSRPEEHPASDGDPIRVAPSPSSTPSPAAPTKGSREASATPEPTDSATPTLEPTPTPEAPSTSDEPSPKTTSKPGVKADVNVDLDDLDVDVDVELGGVDLEVDLDVGSVLGALTG